MRTADDFNLFYATPDPWRISLARFRDRVLRRSVAHFIDGKSILELGCGEGHLTQAVFSNARSVTGVDLSDIAINRAKARKLSNARFEISDFNNISFENYDVIAAIECLYYLTPDDQNAFFAKIAREHRGKPLIISGPIIGGNEHRRYFTHTGLSELFARHNISVVEHHNLNVYRRGALANIAALLVWLPFGYRLLDWLPSALIYQRCYIIRSM